MVRRLIAAALLLLAVAVPALAQSPYPPGPPPPVPGLPDSQRQTTYTISGTTCACAVGFQLYGDSTDYQNWLEVWVNGVNEPYNDPSFGWTITSPTGSLATIPRPITDGVLTFNNPQTGTVIIVGAQRPRRTAEFSENQGVPARALNQTLNDLYAINREVWDKINDLNGRGLFFPPGTSVPNILPTVSGGTGTDTSASTGVAQVSSGTWSVSTALANGTTATTQATADSSTKLATTAWVGNVFASPPALGSTAAANVTAATLNITTLLQANGSAGSAGQCLQSNGGASPPQWSSCAAGSAGVNSLGNALTDTTLTITGTGTGPWTGNVLAKLNLANANTWTGGVTVTTNGDNINLNTPAINEPATVVFSDNGTPKWAFINYGNSGDTLSLYDVTATREDISAVPNGNLALMPVAGNVGIGSGATSPSGLLQVSAIEGGTNIYFGSANISGASINVAGGSSGLQTWVTPGAATGTITFPSGTTTLPGLSLNNSWAGNNYFGGGNPWVDVKSGANGCAAAAGDGTTNDRLAIQCQVNWTIANNPYGKVFLPCGTYLVNGGGIDETNGGSGYDPFLQGESVGCTIIEVTDDETALTLGNFTAAQAKPGMDSIFVNCSFSNPTTNCVVISSGPVDIRNSTIQGGRWALVNHGTDGTIFNSYITNIGGIQGTSGNCTASTIPSTTTPLTLCYGNLYTDGANWYIRDKFDQNAVQDFSIYITTTGSSGVTENSFGNTDSSDNARDSLVVFDNGSNHAITTWYGYGPLSTPIYIRSASSTLISNSNMNGGVSNSSISITGTVCGATLTGSGTKTTAGNIGTC